MLTEQTMIAQLLKMRERVKHICPPASSADIQRAEAALGFKLPTLLEKLYGEVANGGFGPEHGVLGLDGGHASDGQSCVKTYLGFRKPYRNKIIWPEFYLPICFRGCSIYSVLDCSSDSGPVVGIDLADGVRPEAFKKESESLFAWMEDWLSKVTQPK